MLSSKAWSYNWTRSEQDNWRNHQRTKQRCLKLYQSKAQRIQDIHHFPIGVSSKTSVGTDSWRNSKDIRSSLQAIIQLCWEVLVGGDVNHSLHNGHKDSRRQERSKSYKSHYAKIRCSQLNILNDVSHKSRLEGATKMIQILNHGGGHFLRDTLGKGILDHNTSRIRLWRWIPHGSDSFLKNAWPAITFGDHLCLVTVEIVAWLTIKTLTSLMNLADISVDIADRGIFPSRFAAPVRTVTNLKARIGPRYSFHDLLSVIWGCSSSSSICHVGLDCCAVQYASRLFVITLENQVREGDYLAAQGTNTELVEGTYRLHDGILVT